MGSNSGANSLTDSDAAARLDPVTGPRLNGHSQPSVDGGAEAIRWLLNWLEVDEGEHTTRTPERVAKAWRECLWGYQEDPSHHLETDFPAPSDPGLIVVHGVELTSFCAHHMFPFTGTATVAYRPHQGQRIVGLSKLARVVKGYSARLQVQERIGSQVADAIWNRLNPSGALCLISASHQCMSLRGVKEPAAVTTTEARRGLWLDGEIALIHQLHRESK